jgi:hypothetical protein
MGVYGHGSILAYRRAASSEAPGDAESIISTENYSGAALRAKMKASVHPPMEVSYESFP